MFYDTSKTGAAIRMLSEAIQRLEKTAKEGPPQLIPACRFEIGAKIDNLVRTVRGETMEGLANPKEPWEEPCGPVNPYMVGVKSNPEKSSP